MSLSSGAVIMWFFITGWSTPLPMCFFFSAKSGSLFSVSKTTRRSWCHFYQPVRKRSQKCLKSLASFCYQLPLFQSCRRSKSQRFQTRMSFVCLTHSPSCLKTDPAKIFCVSHLSFSCMFQRAFKMIFTWNIKDAHFVTFLLWEVMKLGIFDVHFYPKTRSDFVMDTALHGSEKASIPALFSSCSVTLHWVFWKDWQSHCLWNHFEVQLCFERKKT